MRSIDRPSNSARLMTYNKVNKVAPKLEQSVASVLKKAGVRSVVTGVSGGADSVALLLCLHAAGIRQTAVHCNFHLRGAESDRDNIFVVDLCRRYGVELIELSYDVKGYMSRNTSGRKLSVEMACRDLRYADFRRILMERGADRIAVAHNSDDNVETLLLNLFRGSGVSGLRAMLPDNGEIIRPLLSVSRKEIEDYLKEKGVDYIVDSTNLDTEFKRNFIRNSLLPLIETRWPGVRKSMTTTIENLRSEERVVNWSGHRWLDDVGDLLPFDKIADMPDSFWGIRMFAGRYGASRHIVCEINDVYEKKRGSQEIIGKYWNCGGGILKFTKKGLKFLQLKNNC